MTLSLAQIIRAKTTDSTTVLPDSIILGFLEVHADDWRLALADCLEYLAREDVYASYSRGGISRGRNELRDEARYWRAAAAMEGGIQSSTVTRADYDEATGPEFTPTPTYLSR